MIKNIRNLSVLALVASIYLCPAHAQNWNGANNAVDPAIAIVGQTTINGVGNIPRGLNVNNIAGNYSITTESTAIVNTAGTGIRVGAGTSTVTNLGSITSTGERGIRFDGTSTGGNVLNIGSITASAQAIHMQSGGTVENRGTLTSMNNRGIHIVNGGTAINSGIINSQNDGILIAGGGVIINSGTVSSSTSEGLRINGGGTITHSGSILQSTRGVVLQNGGTLNSSGNITAQNVAIVVNNAAGTVNITGGLIQRNTSGVVIDFAGAADTLTIANATIQRPDAGVVVQMGGGDDRVNVGNWARFLAGAGAGILNGQGGTDTLSFNFSGVSSALGAQLQSSVTAQGGTGTVVFRGITYSWQNFETLSVTTTSFESAAQTGNQKAIARAFDNVNFLPSADFLEVFRALDNSGNIAAALDQISPQRYELFSTMLLNQATFSGQQMDGYLSGLRAGTSGFDFSRISMVDKDLEFENLFAGVGNVSKTISDSPMPQSVSTVKAPMKKIGGFISGDLILATQDARSGIPQDIDYTTKGFTLGVDYRVMEKLVVGLTFSYGQTKADFTSNDALSVSTYAPGVYATWYDEGLYVNGLVSYGWNELEQTRGISFGGLSRQASGRTDGEQITANVTVGKDWKMGNFVMGPFLGMQYANLDMDSFSETGAGALNLNVGRQEVDSFRTKLGGAVSYTAKVKSVTIRPNLSLAWQHEFLDDSRGITASLNESGVGSFAVNTNDPERDSALVGVGLNVWWEDWIMLFARYDAQVGQESFFAQGVRGGVKVAF